MYEGQEPREKSLCGLNGVDSVLLERIREFSGDQDGSCWVERNSAWKKVLLDTGTACQREREPEGLLSDAELELVSLSILHRESPQYQPPLQAAITQVAMIQYPLRPAGVSGQWQDRQ